MDTRTRILAALLAAMLLLSAPLALGEEAAALPEEEILEAVVPEALPSEEAFEDEVELLLPPAEEPSPAEDGAAEDALVEILPEEEEVVAPPEELQAASARLVPETAELTMGVKEQQTLGYSFVPASAASQVTFTSSKTKVAEVDEKGTITAKRKGEAVITLTSADGLKCAVEITVLKAPSKVTITGERKQLAVGETLQLGYTLKEKTGGSVTFSGDNDAVATVSPSGAVTGRKAGTVKVTAATYNGKRNTVTLTVVAPPESIKFAESKLRIGAGDSCKLSYTISPQPVGAVTFVSSNEKVARVSDDGTLTALNKGEVTVTAATYNGKKASCAVTVDAAPTAVQLSAQALTLGKGEAGQLSAALQPKGVQGSIEWSSSKPKVVEVDQEGRLTAKRTGSAVITAVSYNGKKASCTVTVLKAPSKVTITGERKQLAVGETLQLGYTLKEKTAGAVTFSGDNDAVATVSPSGAVTGHKAGTVKVTAATYNGKRSTVTLTVVAPPESIKFAESKLRIGAGDSCKLSYTISPQPVGAVTFVSSNEKVARVSDDGTLTALNKGDVTVTATTYNGKKATCAVTVDAAPTAVQLSAQALTLGKGEAGQLSAALQPKGVQGSIEWSSSKPKVVEVDQEGRLTAKRTGSAVITAATYNGKKASCTVTVQKAPSKVEILLEKDDLGVGDTIRIGCELSRKSAGQVEWAVSPADAAKIDAQAGTLTALKPGTFKLGCRTYNGKTAVATLRVWAAPTSIAFPERSLKLGRGETATAKAALNEGAYGTISYRSKNEGIARVDGEGRITGVAVGKTQIVASCQVEGLTAVLQVEVTPAPTFVKLPYSEIKLYRGDTFQLEPQVDEGLTAGFTYSSSKTRYARVDENGLVTGVKKGSAVITVSTGNGKKCTVKVSVVSEPSSVRFSEDSLTMNVGETRQLKWNVDATVLFDVEDGSVASVSAEGRLTALKAGKTRVRITTYNGKYDLLALTVKGAPTGLTISVPATIALGETVQAQAVFQPEDADLPVTWSASGSAISVDAEGSVTGLKAGSAVLKAVSGSLSAQVTVKVVKVEEIIQPTSVTVTNVPKLLEIGASWTPQVKVKPSGASSRMEWTTSDPNILLVDNKGTLHALSFGHVTVMGSCVDNPMVTVTLEHVIVDSPDLTLTLPDRRTTTAEISANKKKIQAVEQTSLEVLKTLKSQGSITSSEYTNRKAAVERAFSMYEFAWMTETTELYWKAKNSEDGAKDFKPGTVYYGLPYTQNNRHNSAESVVSAGTYKNTGKGYYLMQGSKFSDRMYPGNDCSSFASTALWGYSSSRSTDTTRDIARASYYTTITDWKAMRTGDLINKSGAHVVVFLYYTDAAKTQFMLIEQGGNEAAINTVSCNVRTVAFYRDNGYSIRRPK